MHNESQDDTCYCCQECRKTGVQTQQENSGNQDRDGTNSIKTHFQSVIQDDITKKDESEEDKEIGDLQCAAEGESSRMEEPNSVRKRATRRAAADRIGTYAEADSDDEQLELILMYHLIIHSRPCTPPQRHTSHLTVNYLPFGTRRTCNCTVAKMCTRLPHTQLQLTHPRLTLISHFLASAFNVGA